MIEIVSTFVVLGKIQARCITCNRSFIADKILLSGVLVDEKGNLPLHQDYIQCPYCRKYTYLTIEVHIQEKPG